MSNRERLKELFDEYKLWEGNRTTVAQNNVLKPLEKKKILDETKARLRHIRNEFDAIKHI